MGDVRATTSFAAGRVHVREGVVLPDDDPVVAGREHLFEPVVETATAAPGEKRRLPQHECPVCGRKARSRAGLVAHMRVHEGGEL